MAMKLHGVPMSTCTSRVMICLHEKEVEFELVQGNLFNGYHKQASYLKKNPFGLTPVLEDGDITLFGSRAITAYIAEKYKDRGTDLLREKDVKEAAMVKVWTEVESQQFKPVIEPIIYQHFICPMRGKETNQLMIEESLERLGKVLDVYDVRLRENKFIGGDFYSLADLHHLPCLFYFMKSPFAALLDGYPQVKRWWEDISSRPSFLKVSPTMNFTLSNSDL